MSTRTGALNVWPPWQLTSTQVSVEADRALSCILGKRARYSGERRSAGVAADLDDVINADICLRHGGRIKKSKAFAVIFSKTTMDG